LIEFREIPADSIPLSLLLEADPSEDCIEKYLSGSLSFGAFIEGEIVGACVTNSNQIGISEIFNIAIVPTRQKQGIGTKLLEFAIEQLASKGVIKVVLGTGTFGHQLTFYQRLGFRVDAVVKNFFIDNYRTPIYENGLQLKDMLRLILNLK